MNLFESIILGTIQGLTEFFPISSSGHLIVFQTLLGLEVKELLIFDIIVHAGSLLAIFIFFTKSKTAISWKNAFLISVPILLMGYLNKDYIENLREITLVGTFFIINGLYLIYHTVKKVKHPPNRQISLTIASLYHTLGLFPGISRSGSIIGILNYLGISQEEAVKISFQSGLITLSFATFYAIYKLITEGFIESVPIEAMTGGFISSTIMSLICIYLLTWIGRNRKIWIFGVYTLIIGIISLSLVFR